MREERNALVVGKVFRQFCCVYDKETLIVEALSPLLMRRNTLMVESSDVVLALLFVCKFTLVRKVFKSTFSCLAVSS